MEYIEWLQDSSDNILSCLFQIDARLEKKMEFKVLLNNVCSQEKATGTVKLDQLKTDYITIYIGILKSRLQLLLYCMSNGKKKTLEKLQLCDEPLNEAKVKEVPRRFSRRKP